MVCTLHLLAYTVYSMVLAMERPLALDLYTRIVERIKQLYNPEKIKTGSFGNPCSKITIKLKNTFFFF
jgi:hypothetical protein